MTATRRGAEPNTAIVTLSHTHRHTTGVSQPLAVVNATKEII
jgi:hypothetical protein